MDNSKAHTGYLTAYVTTALGAIPLEGANVKVFEYQNENENNKGSLITSRITNREGKTDKIPLEAPPRINSQSKSSEKSYYTYNLEVFLEGYYPQQYINVPIFENIHAIQEIDLLPISENGKSYTYDNIFYESENQFLE